MRAAPEFTLIEPCNGCCLRAMEYYVHELDSDCTDVAEPNAKAGDPENASHQAMTPRVSPMHTRTIESTCPTVTCCHQSTLPCSPPIQNSISSFVTCSPTSLIKMAQPWWKPKSRRSEALPQRYMFPTGLPLFPHIGIILTSTPLGASRGPP